jgi:hypothetical protein
MGNEGTRPMRWNKPERRPETYWKPWFAWHPVKIEDTGQTVWLEWVWRHVDRYAGGMLDYAYWPRYRSDVHWASANLEHREGWPNALRS